MMKRKKCGLALCIAAVLIALVPQAGAQTIRFVRESLAFTVAPDSFRFDGVYYFDNPGPDTVRREIYYPFVLRADPPDTTVVLRASNGEEMRVSKGEDGVSFEALLPPFSTQAYHITFSQRAPRRTFEYILTTTAAWGAPLESMTIAVQAPAGLRVTGLSLKADRIEPSSGARRYLIDRTNYMPDRNFIVTWERMLP